MPGDDGAVGGVESEMSDESDVLTESDPYGLSDAEQDAVDQNEQIVDTNATEKTTTFTRVDGEPDTPVEHKQRGTCAICGNPATHGRSFYCADHEHLSPTINKITSPRRPRTPEEELKLRDKSKKNQLVKFILDNNENIVRAEAFMLQIPDEWLDAVIGQGPVVDPQGNPVFDKLGQPVIMKFWEPSLRSQLEISKREAEFVGGAVLKFGDSPQAKLFLQFGKVIQPYLEIGIAIGFVAVRIHKMNQLRVQIEFVKAQQQVEMQRRQGPMANNGSVPFPQSPTSDSNPLAGDVDEETMFGVG